MILVSIHASNAGGDTNFLVYGFEISVSIHASHVGGDSN